MEVLNVEIDIIISELPLMTIEQLRKVRKQVNANLAEKRKRLKEEKANAKFRRQVRKIQSQRNKDAAKIEYQVRFKERFGPEVDPAQAYSIQLTTDEWKEKRRETLQLKGCACEVCGCKENLAVHHPYYIAGHFAWEYPAKDLLVLCNTCHEIIHDSVRARVLPDEVDVSVYIKRCQDKITLLRNSLKNT